MTSIVDVIVGVKKNIDVLESQCTQEIWNTLISGEPVQSIPPRSSNKEASQIYASAYNTGSFPVPGADFKKEGLIKIVVKVVADMITYMRRDPSPQASGNIYKYVDDNAKKIYLETSSVRSDDTIMMSNFYNQYCVCMDWLDVLGCLLENKEEKHTFIDWKRCIDISKLTLTNTYNKILEDTKLSLEESLSKNKGVLVAEQKIKFRIAEVLLAYYRNLKHLDDVNFLRAIRMFASIDIPDIPVDTPDIVRFSIIEDQDTLRLVVN
jgi:hypothetical protein